MQPSKSDCSRCQLQLYAASRYKNFKCDWHNKFFKVYLYQKDPINRHHWVNEELGLSLGLESAWEAQLTCYNTLNFIFDYSRPSAAGLITFSDVNEWVDTALGMTLKSTLRGTRGRKQFQEVVDTLFKLCEESEWASKCEEDVMRTLSAGPNQQLRDSSQHKEEEEQTSSLFDKVSRYKLSLR